MGFDDESVAARSNRAMASMELSIAIIGRSIRQEL
jgi:hypothetical protein